MEFTTFSDTQAALRLGAPIFWLLRVAFVSPDGRYAAAEWLLARKNAFSNNGAPRC